MAYSTSFKHKTCTAVVKSVHTHYGHEGHGYLGVLMISTILFPDAIGREAGYTLDSLPACQSP